MKSPQSSPHHLARLFALHARLLKTGTIHSAHAIEIGTDPSGRGAFRAELRSQSPAEGAMDALGSATGPTHASACRRLLAKLADLFPDHADPVDRKRPGGLDKRPHL